MFFCALNYSLDEDARMPYVALFKERVCQVHSDGHYHTHRGDAGHAHRLLRCRTHSATTAQHRTAQCRQE